MTPIEIAELNCRLADLCGWRECKPSADGTAEGIDSYGHGPKQVPIFLVDLDAVSEAEENCIEVVGKSAWLSALIVMVAPALSVTEAHSQYDLLDQWTMVARATATERCMAIILAMGWDQPSEVPA